MKKLLASIAYAILLMPIPYFVSGQVIETAPQINWERNFGGTENDFFRSIFQTSDGGYLAFGQANSDDELIDDHHGSTTFEDAWIVKLTPSNGVISWEKSFGGDLTDRVNDAVEIADGYVFAGETRSNDPGDDIQNSFGLNDAWVFRLNDAGLLQWSFGYGTSSSDEANTVVATADGGFLVGGSRAEPDTAWLFKINQNGIINFDKRSGAVRWGYTIDRIINTTDGGFLFIGKVAEAGLVCGLNCIDEGAEFNSDIWVVKLNKNLQIQWNRQYGGGGCDYANNVLEVETGYILTGEFVDCPAIPAPENFGGHFLMLLNFNGNISWIRPSRIEESGLVVLDYEINRGALNKTVDGGLITGGRRVNSFSYFSCIEPTVFHIEYFIVKYDLDGFPLWMERFGGSNTDYIFAIQEIFGGGYIVGGYSNSDDLDVGGNYGASDWWIAELSPEDEYCHLKMDAHQAYANIASVEVNGNAQSYVVDAEDIIQFDLSVDINAANSHIWYVLIDYNQDTDFDDPGESVSFVRTAPPDINNSIVSTIFLTIPPTALNGNTRMRIIVHATGTITDFCVPCIAGPVGDVHDYNIMINSDVICPQERMVNINPIPSGIYSAISKISSSSTIAWDNEVTFVTLGVTELNEGFEVRNGCIFNVIQMDCTGL